MRKFLKNNEANMQEIGFIVGLLITIAISVLVFYTLAASFDIQSVDEDLAGTPFANATNATLEQSATFFTIAPIIGIVVIAVVILGYVSSIGGRRE